MWKTSSLSLYCQCWYHKVSLKFSWVHVLLHNYRWQLFQCLFFNKLSNHVNNRANNLDENKDACSLKTSFLVLNLLPQCLLHEELNTVFSMTVGVFMGRYVWTKRLCQGTTKGLASVRKMKILRRKINNLTYHWECKCDSIFTEVSGRLIWMEFVPLSVRKMVTLKWINIRRKNKNERCDLLQCEASQQNQEAHSVKVMTMRLNQVLEKVL